jgi:hypothetical protein
MALSVRLNAMPSETFKATQQRLVGLLTIELELGFAFANLGSHQWERSSREQSCQSARESVTIIRYFEGTISDARDWWKIHARADKLELMLREFPHRDSLRIISN